MANMYDKALFFNTYFSKATEKQLFVEKLTQKLSPKDESLNLSLLDLGSHDGLLLSKFFNTSGVKKIKKVVAVDPSAQALHLFKNRSDLPEIGELSLYAQTFEDFVTKNHDRFDFILASHCFYWSPDLKACLLELKKRSKRSVIVLRGSKGIYEIQKKFKNFLGNENEMLYKSDDIKKALTELEIDFTTDRLDSKIEIPSNPIERKWLYAFFLQTDDHLITDSLLADIDDFVFNHLLSPIKHDVDIFWVQND